jgi:hypothetical protein
MHPQTRAPVCVVVRGKGVATQVEVRKPTYRQQYNQHGRGGNEGTLRPESMKPRLQTSKEREVQPA